MVADSVVNCPYSPFKLTTPATPAYNTNMAATPIENIPVALCCSLNILLVPDVEMLGGFVGLSVGRGEVVGRGEIDGDKDGSSVGASG